MKAKEEKRICDNCENFHVSPGGSSESCYINRRGSLVIPMLSADYIDERINGNQKTCKEFRKI
jgi:hypothetical protein